MAEVTHVKAVTRELQDNGDLYATDLNRARVHLGLPPEPPPEFAVPTVAREGAPTQTT